MLRNGRQAIRGSMDGLDPPLAPNSDYESEEADLEEPNDLESSNTMKAQLCRFMGISVDTDLKVQSCQSRDLARISHVSRFFMRQLVCLPRSRWHWTLSLPLPFSGVGHGESGGPGPGPCEARGPPGKMEAGKRGYHP